MRQTGFHSSDDFQGFNSQKVSVAAAAPGAGEVGQVKLSNPTHLPWPSRCHWRTASISPASFTSLSFPTTLLIWGNCHSNSCVDVTLLTKHCAFLWTITSRNEEISHAGSQSTMENFKNIRNAIQPHDLAQAGLALCSRNPALHCGCYKWLFCT